MSLTGPMATFFGLVERKPGFVEVHRQNDASVSAYRIYCSPSPNDAYGDPGGAGTSNVGGAGPVLLFALDRDTHYVSRVLRRTGRVSVQESKRNQTWATFDIREFLGPGIALPQDGDWMFLRVQEFRVALGAWATFDTGEGGGPEAQYGPIYCVPPPRFFGMRHPAFFLTGTAPAGTDCVLGAVPVFNESWTGLGPPPDPVMNPMYLVFPRPVREITITNTDLANTLLVSTGTGHHMIELAVGASITYQETAIKELVLSGGTALTSASFTLAASIGLE